MTKKERNFLINFLIYFLSWVLAFMVNFYYAIHETGFWKYIAIPICTFCLLVLLYFVVEIMNYKNEDNGKEE
jgi:hypothetical protein